MNFFVFFIFLETFSMAMYEGYFLTLDELVLTNEKCEDDFATIQKRFFSPFENSDREKVNLRYNLDACRWSVKKIKNYLSENPMGIETSDIDIIARHQSHSNEIIPNLYLGGVNSVMQDDKERVPYKYVVSILADQDQSRVKILPFLLKLFNAQPDSYEKELLFELHKDINNFFSGFEIFEVPNWEKLTEFLRGLRAKIADTNPSSPLLHQLPREHQPWREIKEALFSFSEGIVQQILKRPSGECWTPITTGDTARGLKPLSDRFGDIFTTIDTCLKNREPVLLHCNAGLSRSVTVVVAYLMSRFGLTCPHAHAFVAHKRPGAWMHNLNGSTYKGVLDRGVLFEFYKKAMNGDLDFSLPENTLNPEERLQLLRNKSMAMYEGYFLTLDELVLTNEKCEDDFATIQKRFFSPFENSDREKVNLRYNLDACRWSVKKIKNYLSENPMGIETSDIDIIARHQSHSNEIIPNLYLGNSHFLIEDDKEGVPYKYVVSILTNNDRARVRILPFLIGLFNPPLDSEEKKFLFELHEFINNFFSGFEIFEVPNWEKLTEFLRGLRAKIAGTNPSSPLLHQLPTEHQPWSEIKEDLFSFWESIIQQILKRPSGEYWTRITTGDTARGLKPLSDRFGDIFTTIDTCLKNREPVLVHCNAGLSRSVTLVMAYLMSRFGLTCPHAHAFVAHKRPGAWVHNFNGSTYKGVLDKGVLFEFYKKAIEGTLDFSLPENTLNPEERLQLLRNESTH